MLTRTIPSVYYRKNHILYLYHIRKYFKVKINISVVRAMLIGSVKMFLSDLVTCNTNAICIQTSIDNQQIINKVLTRIINQNTCRQIGPFKTV